MFRTNNGAGLTGEMKISFFKNVTARNNVPVSLAEVFAMIKDGHCQGIVTKGRFAVLKEDWEDYDAIKKTLPAFTPSGVFCAGHSKKELETYNPVVILDIDKVGLNEAAELRRKASGIPTTFAAFVSPSGRGLKILVKTDSTIETHENAFEQVSKYYEEALDVSIDKSGKDYSRLCFLPYDPDIYVNNDSKPFNLEKVTNEKPINNVSTTLDDTLFENVITFTDRVQQYYPDNRNNHIYLLANNLNRIGIPQDEAEAKIKIKYPEMKKDNEISNSVNSAYSNHTAEYGTFSPDYINSVSLVRTARAVNNAKIVSTPFISEEVYSNLPNFLKRGTDAFEIPREKDVFLTGALVILSGCFNTVKGIYDRRQYYPNLNCFIIAPPASGKGVLNSSRDLAMHIHNTIEKTYQAELAKENGDVSKLKRTHFIAADSSSASFKENLKSNKETGTVCETEADTLSNTLQMEWGSYSDLIRKAFQHEPVTYSRLDQRNGIRINEIKQPKLSICLTGTPNQVPKLLHSTEDGLFSRIIFYTYKNDGIPYFKDVFADFTVRDLTEYFNSLSGELYRLYEQSNKNTSVTFHLQAKQEGAFVKHFDKMVKRINFEFGEETRSVVIRLGLITYRIAMILTILRSFENNKFEKNIYCEDLDFNTSLKLSKIYVEHALAVYSSLPGSVTIKSGAQSLFEILPENFVYADAVKIGKTIADISEKTVYNYLLELKEARLLKQPKSHGPYLK